MKLNLKRLECTFVAYLIFLSSNLLTGSVIAQTDPTREELKGLQKQIETLNEGQKSMQKDLQEIKTLLQGRAAPPNLPPQDLTVSLGNKPVKGDKNAKLTLVEFSDYQCPFCSRSFRETLPQIEKEYVLTGKLKYILRDFPIESIHKDAFKAAEAANCAGEQGKYWEMHDRLFQNQNQLGVEELPKHAQAIGLNGSTFQQCLDSGKQATEVRKDMEDGQKAGVQGTPTFLLGIQDSDSQAIKVLRVIVGAQPYAQFKEAVESVLSQVKK
ncbi:DsbA family protein [bacterium]|nr:MAG: DsbA family protein [bacterium]